MEKLKRGRPAINTLFKQFAKCQVNLEHFGGLPSLNKASKIWDEIWFIEAHNSTGLEGNTLVLSEVKALLKRNVNIGGKKTADYLEVIGYGQAAKWVYTQAKEPQSYAPDKDIITQTEIRNIHYILLKAIWEVAPHKNALPEENPGSYRKHDILPFPKGMTPPSFMEIDAQMTDFIRDTNRICSDILMKKINSENIPLILAEIHCSFEKIHPFLDGNGRTGRLILNLILVRLGFPPCIILKSRRKRYLEAMDLADKKNYKPLAEILSRGILDNVHRFIIPEYMKEKDLVSLQSLVNKEFTYSALRQAASRGKLNVKIGEDGTYYSTPASLEEYKNNRYKK
jgi:Fic family protein